MQVVPADYTHRNVKTHSQFRGQAIPNPRGIQFYASAALVGSVICWGVVPVLLRQLTHFIDGWTANGFRYPFAAMLYWPVLLLAFRSGRLNRQIILHSLLPSMLALCGQVLWGHAPYHLDASAIGFFVRFSMLWSLIGAMTLYHDERRLLTLPRFYAGLLLTVGGFVALAISKGLSDPEVSGTGITIMFFTTMFFGLYAVSVRHLLRSTPPLIGFGVVSQFVSMGTFSMMFWQGRPHQLLELSAFNWCLLIASSVLGVAMGHFLLYTAVKRLGASLASGAQTTTPFVTAVVALIFLDESLSAFQWGAGIVMVIGAALLLAAQHVIEQDTKRPLLDGRPIAGDN